MKASIPCEHSGGVDFRREDQMEGKKKIYISKRVPRQEK